jgi:uncharacterized protein
VKSKKEYTIQFIGLKLGVHVYTFEVGKTFFADRTYSIIEDGTLSVSLKLEKKETMLLAEFTVDGIVSTQCDRCNDPLELPVNGVYNIIYKFGLEDTDDETLIVLHPDAYEIDLSDQIYEFIVVSLPTRLMHKQGACNEEMVQLISQFMSPNQQTDDSYDDDDDDDDWGDDDDQDDWDDDDEPTDDAPIDPRWSALKHLN